jgi:hypothetical protein
MQNRLLIRSLLLFLITTCFALALQSSAPTKLNKVGLEKCCTDLLIFLSSCPLVNKLLEIKDLSKKVPDLSGRYFRLFTRYEIYPGNHSFANNDTFQQWADTKNTINKVSGLVNDNFAPENAPVSWK